MKKRFSEEQIIGFLPDGDAGIAVEDLCRKHGFSVAMMLNLSFGQPQAAERIHAAVRAVLADGYRTADIHRPGTRRVGTREMGDAVVSALWRRM